MFKPATSAYKGLCCVGVGQMFG